jgi:hypothetical protein
MGYYIPMRLAVKETGRQSSSSPLNPATDGPEITYQVKRGVEDVVVVGGLVGMTVSCTLQDDDDEEEEGDGSRIGEQGGVDAIQHDFEKTTRGTSKGEGNNVSSPSKHIIHIVLYPTIHHPYPPSTPHQSTFIHTNVRRSSNRNSKTSCESVSHSRPPLQKKQILRCRQARRASKLYFTRHVTRGSGVDLICSLSISS